MGETGRGYLRLALIGSLLSGATSLTLAVAWTRLLCSLFGSPTYVVVTAVTVILFALALGAVAMGRFADRSERSLALFGGLQIGIGLWAVLFPWVAAGSSAVYGWFYRTAEPASITTISIVRLGVLLVLLLPPGLLIGGTLPVLERMISAGRFELEREVGGLYGWHALGAAAGCFLSVFFLLEDMGVRAAMAVGACTAIAVGLPALVVGLLAKMSARREPARQVRSARSRPDLQEPSLVEGRRAAMLRLLLVAVGISGACSLAFGWLSSRVLLFGPTLSPHAWATIVTTLLTGIAMGGCLSARFVAPHMRQPRRWLCALEILAGIAVLGCIPLLASLANVDAEVGPHYSRNGQWHLVLLQFAAAFAVLFLPALLMGAVFPIVTTAYLPSRVAVGRCVGQVYGANAIGCAAGLLLTCFVLLPASGTLYGLLIVVALHLTLGVILVATDGSRPLGVRVTTAMAAAAVAGVAFLATPPDAFYDVIAANHAPSRIVFLKEHCTATVAVHDLLGGERVLVVDGVTVAGRAVSSRTEQKLRGYIPLCLHGEPSRVLQIGFGGGETARVVTGFGVREYVVVEACPAVFAAGEYFKDINGGSYLGPKVRRVMMDGRTFVSLSSETFDVVINMPGHPRSRGCRTMYTTDHFRRCRKRLREGGLLACSLPLDLRPAEIRVILGSFQEVFPNACIWRASNCVSTRALLLGSLGPWRIDIQRLAAVTGRPQIAPDLAAIGIRDVYDLLACHVCDGRSIRRILAEAEKSTGDGPPQTAEGRSLFESSATTGLSSDARLKEGLSMLIRHYAPVTSYLVNFAENGTDRATLVQRCTAARWIHRGQWWQLAGIPQRRRLAFAEALKANPGEIHVRSCQVELDQEIRTLQPAVAAAPTEDALAERLANRLFIALRYPEATEIYERLVRSKSPPSPRAFVNLAQIRIDEEKLAEAEGLLRQCLAHWPDGGDAHDRLAKVYLRTGRLRAARYHVTRAVRIAPDNTSYQTTYAQVAKMH